MKRITFVLGIALLFSLLALPASAQGTKGVTAYQEIVDLAPDGSAQVTTNLTLVNWDADKLDLPLNVSKPDAVVAEAKDVKVTAAAGKTGDVNVIKVQFEGKPPAEVKLKLSYRVKEFFNWDKAKTPRGIYNFAYTFTNATATNIGGYALKVLLPPGYTMNGVGSSTPKATGEEVEPPYNFVTEGDRLAVNLRSPSVGAGKNAAIAFGIQQSARNPLPLVALGAVIAALALYMKRDVLTRPDFVKETAA